MENAHDRGLNVDPGPEVPPPSLPENQMSHVAAVAGLFLLPAVALATERWPAPVSFRMTTQEIHSIPPSHRGAPVVPDESTLGVSGDDRYSPRFHQALKEAEIRIQEALEEYGVPGASFAVVDREGVLSSRGFGTLASGGVDPVTPETVFSVQSISKTFTGVAVMLAVQDGLLDLDTPITEYLPAFTVNSRFEEHPERRMTLRHLLSHTAGFTHEAPVGNNIDAHSPSFEDHVASISDTWLRSPVGERYLYSNLGIDLAGFILQQVTGVPYESYVRERLMEPLGMHDSFVDEPNHNAAHCAGCARGHDPGFIELPDYIPLTASGGVRVSAEDGARFVRFMLNQGEIDGLRLLSEDLVREMFRPAADRHTAFQGLDDAQYGLGVYSYRGHGTYAVNHDGGGFGFRTSMKWYPEYGVGYVLLINSASAGATRVWEVVWTLLGELIEDGAIPLRSKEGIASADQHFMSAPGRQVPAALRDSDLESLLPLKDPEMFVGEYHAGFGGGFRAHPERRVPAWDIVVSHEAGVLQLRAGGAEPEPLVQFLPGLFFGVRSGEALDFRGGEVRWRNIPMQAVEPDGGSGSSREPVVGSPEFPRSCGYPVGKGNRRVQPDMSCPEGRGCRAASGDAGGRLRGARGR